MAWWNDLNIRWKLTLPIGLIAVLLIGESVLKYNSKQEIFADFNRMQAGYFQAETLVLNADRDLYQAALAERTIMTTGPNPSLFSVYQENIEQVKTRVTAAQSLSIDAAITEDMTRFLQSMEQWQAKGSDILFQIQNGKMSAETAVNTRLEELSKDFNTARDQLDRIGERIKAKSETLGENIRQNIEGADRLSFITTAVVLTITGLTLWLLPQSLSKAANRLQVGIASISSGEGDLTQRISVQGADELGLTSGHFNRFLDNLQTLIRSIAESARAVDRYASEMDEAAAENDSYSKELSDSIKLMSTSITQMSVAIDEVANNTESVSSETNNADQEAKNVAQTFDEAIRVIGELCDDVDRSVHAIQSLKEQAVSIASVVDVIQGIAEQTNLLALNAAIEAARAGEQGRGFAVVADEVRSLASKTQDSTEDINKIIVSLQNGVSEVVHAMDVVKTNATSTVSTASHAKQSLNGVVTSLSNINGRAIQVASAIDEQSATVNDIANNIELIISLADNLSARAGTIAEIGTRFKSESRQLDGKVGTFTV